jgi:hypothetical protein
VDASQQPAQSDAHKLLVEYKQLVVVRRLVVEQRQRRKVTAWPQLQLERV